MLYCSKISSEYKLSLPIYWFKNTSYESTTFMIVYFNFFFLYFRMSPKYFWGHLLKIILKILLLSVLEIGSEIPNPRSFRTHPHQATRDQSTHRHAFNHTFSESKTIFKMFFENMFYFWNARSSFMVYVKRFLRLLGNYVRWSWSILIIQVEFNWFYLLIQIILGLY